MFFILFAFGNTKSSPSQFKISVFSCFCVLFRRKWSVLKNDDNFLVPWCSLDRWRNPWRYLVFLDLPASFISVNVKNGGDSHRDRSVGALTHHHYCVLVSLEFAAVLPPIQPIHWWPSGTSQWVVSWSIQKLQRSKYLTGRIYKAPHRQYYC